MRHDVTPSTHPSIIHQHWQYSESAAGPVLAGCIAWAVFGSGFDQRNVLLRIESVEDALSVCTVLSPTAEALGRQGISNYRQSQTWHYQTGTVIVPRWALRDVALPPAAEDCTLTTRFLAEYFKTTETSILTMAFAVAVLAGVDSDEDYPAEKMTAAGLELLVDAASHQAANKSLYLESIIEGMWAPGEVAISLKSLDPIVRFSHSSSAAGGTNEYVHLICVGECAVELRVTLLGEDNDEGTESCCFITWEAGDSAARERFFIDRIKIMLNEITTALLIVAKGLPDAVAAEVLGGLHARLAAMRD